MTHHKSHGSKQSSIEELSGDNWAIRGNERELRGDERGWEEMRGGIRRDQKPHL